MPFSNSSDMAHYFWFVKNTQIKVSDGTIVIREIAIFGQKVLAVI